MTSSTPVHILMSGFSKGPICGDSTYDMWRDTYYTLAGYISYGSSMKDACDHCMGIAEMFRDSPPAGVKRIDNVFTYAGATGVCLGCGEAATKTCKDCGEAICDQCIDIDWCAECLEDMVTAGP